LKRIKAKIKKKEEEEVNGQKEKWPEREEYAEEGNAIARPK
jgi:hypothetical protein